MSLFKETNCFHLGPSLISLMVSVDVKHHVYLLTSLGVSCIICTNVKKKLLFKDINAFHQECYVSYAQNVR